jgi:ADP-ribose pyrophosphatase YjhB (NUDIX family)
MEPRPVVTVAAVAERDGRFLVVEERDHGAAVFNQPAGHLEGGETPLEAVRREVLEESGWEFEPQSIVGIYLYPNPAQRVSYLRLCFAGRCGNHHPERPLDAGILRCCWMSRAELAERPERLRSPLVLRCIDDFLDGKTYPLDLIRRVVSGGG